LRPGPRLARSTLSRVKNRAYYEARTEAARAQFLVLASPAVDLGAALDAWGLGNAQWFVPIADPGQLGDGAGATLQRPKEVALLKRTQVVHKYLQLQIASKATAPAFQRAVGKYFNVSAALVASCTWDNLHIGPPPRGVWRWRPSPRGGWRWCPSSSRGGWRR